MTLEDLFASIEVRATADPEKSWTASLLAQGPEKCAEKFGEEAIEAIIEAVKDDKMRLTSEAADVLFHLLVMLIHDCLTECAIRQFQQCLVRVCIPIVHYG